MVPGGLPKMLIFLLLEMIVVLLVVLLLVTHPGGRCHGGVPPWYTWGAALVGCSPSAAELTQPCEGPGERRPTHCSRTITEHQH